MILPELLIVAFAYYELYLFPKTEFEFLFDVLMLFKDVYNCPCIACVFEMSFSLVPNKRCFWAVCNLLSVKQL